MASTDNLGGKVALITGGGRGIGRAIAIGLARAGARVAVLSRSLIELMETVRLIEEVSDPGFGLAIEADVTDESSVHQAVDRINREFDRIDILINNAGNEGPIGPMWENNPTEWWRCLEVNILGVFLCIHAVVPKMMQAPRSRIINVASASGLQPRPYMSAYALSKMGVIRLTEQLSLELRPLGIYVFAIHPGGIRTDMVEKLGRQDATKKWLPKIAEGIKKGPFQSTESATELVVKLASGAADCISGSYISVTDDLDSLVERYGV